jgi:hypothetical protein
MIAEHGTSRSAAAAWIEWVDFNSRFPDALSSWQSLKGKTLLLKAQRMAVTKTEFVVFRKAA